MTEEEKLAQEEARQKAMAERKAKVEQEMAEVRERNRRMKEDYEKKQGNKIQTMNYKLWFGAGGLMLAAAALLCFVGGFRRN